MKRILRPNTRIKKGIHHPLLAIDCENDPKNGDFICAGVFGDVRGRRINERINKRQTHRYEVERVDKYFTNLDAFNGYLLSLEPNSCKLVFFNLSYDKIYINNIINHASVLNSGTRVITLQLKNRIKAIDLANHVEAGDSLDDWIKHLDMTAKYGIAKAELTDYYNRVMNDAKATYYLGAFLEDFYYNECGIPLMVTVGAAAMRLFTQKYFTDYWVRDSDFISNYEREAYYGGRVELFKRGRQHTFNYDVNSMYLAIMRDELFPDIWTTQYIENGSIWRSFFNRYMGIYHCRVESPLTNKDFTDYEVELSQADVNIAVLTETIATDKLSNLLSLWRRVQRRKDQRQDLTLKEYSRFTGKAHPPATSITPDKKHVYWRDALDSIVSEYGYDDTEQLAEALDKLYAMGVELDNLKAKAIYLNNTIIQGKYKNIGIAVLPVRIDGKLKFPVGVFDGYWTNVELQTAVEAGYKILGVYDFIFYRQCKPYFREYAKFVWAKRKEYKARNNIGMDKMIKKLGNTLYGKFAQRNKHDYFGKLEDCPHLPEVCQFFDVKGEVWVLAKGERTPARFEFPSLSAFITSYARRKLYKAMIANKTNIVYCDTDSIKIKCPAVGITIGNELGEWGFEGELNAEFYRPKFYADKCKGVPKRAVEVCQLKHKDLHIKNIIKEYFFDKPLREREAVKRGLTPNVWRGIIKVLTFKDDKRDWKGKKSRPLYYSN